MKFSIISQQVVCMIQITIYSINKAKVYVLTGYYFEATKDTWNLALFGGVYGTHCEYLAADCSCYMKTIFGILVWWGIWAMTSASLVGQPCRVSRFIDQCYVGVILTSLSLCSVSIFTAEVIPDCRVHNFFMNNILSQTLAFLQLIN